MSNKTIMQKLKRFKSAGSKSRLRKDYYSQFLPLMIYRTTKTENPTVSRRQVNEVLKKIAV